MAATSSGVSSIRAPAALVLDPFGLDRFRDDDIAMRDMPGDDHLRGRRVVLPADGDQGRIIEIAP